MLLSCNISPIVVLLFFVVWSVEDQGLGLRLTHVEGFRGWDFEISECGQHGGPRVPRP